MGRSSTTKRTQGLPGQHSKQHESGIVGPGKKVVPRIGSNGHVNGGAMQRQPSDKLSLPNTTTTTTSTTTPSSTSTPPLLPTPPGDDSLLYNKDTTLNGKAHSELLRRISTEVHPDSSSGESYQQVMPSKCSTAQDSQCQIDVNCTKNPAVHHDNSHSTAPSSMLSTRPCIDTVALLCVLLNVPHYLVTICYIIFIFWEPALSIKTFPKSLDQLWEMRTVFGGSLGLSSWKTTATWDSVLLIVWLLIPKSWQQPFLNLASSFLAMSLMSGDTGQRNSDIKNVLACLGIILVSRFARLDAITNFKIFNSFLPTTLTALGVAPDDGRLVPPPPPPPQDHKGFEAWTRTILAIHILTQGTVQYVQRWIIRRERQDILFNSSSDPDSVKGAFIHNENTTNETTTNSTFSGSTIESDAHTASNLEKLHNPRRKKKVYPLLKIHQPLWTQLGHFKILVMKSWLPATRTYIRAFVNACLQRATTTKTTSPDDLGNASFAQGVDNIWITNITYDEVFFSTSALSQHASATFSPTTDIVGIDMTKPFYVRVGRNPWMLSRINKAQATVESSGTASARVSQDTQWYGKIYGLSPAQLSHIEFVRTVDGSVLFSTSVQTLQAPMVGNNTTPAPLLSPVVQQSPKTALRMSIATQEAKREDERNRQKQQRKDVKSRLNALRREIDKLVSSISSASPNDDRLRQKLQQATHSAKQADDATQTFAQELHDLSSIPESEDAQYKSEKILWQSQNDAHAIQLQSFESFKKECDNELAKLATDVASYQAKCDGLLNRIKKQDDKMEKLHESNARDLAELEHQQLQRTRQVHDRETRIRGLREQINRVDREINDLKSSLHNISSTNQVFQQEHDPSSYAYFNQYSSMDAGMQNNSPVYPWNPAANYEPHLMNNTTPVSASSPLDSQHRLRNRGRSSSMLSGVSGFTEVSNGDGENSVAVARDTQDIIDRARSDDGYSASSPSTSVGNVSPALLLASRFVPPSDTSSS